MMLETHDPNRLLDVEPQIIPLREPGCTDTHALGDAVECFAADYFGLTHDRSTHHDARTDTDAPVQTKGARWRIENGVDAHGKQKYTTGRYRLYEHDHEWLLANDGWYAFVVYEKLCDAIVPVYARMMRAQDVDDWVIDGDDPWHDTNTDHIPKDSGTDYRVPWTAVFPKARGTL